ncbi:MAG: hypothetical protein KGZ58_07785 [Ignavibacteriales bacterium]|nr:hypothetical protein [Ignavibacteriales bacterium]
MSNSSRNSSPNLLDLVNTYSNWETKNNTEQIARTNEEIARSNRYIAMAQEQMNAQLLAIEQQKQYDNNLYSQLVDFIVNAKGAIVEEKYLDALIAAGSGVLLFHQIYPGITDGDIKLKTSEIQNSLFTLMKSIVTDPIYQKSVEKELSEFITNFHDNLSKSSTQRGTFSDEILLFENVFSTHPLTIRDIEIGFKKDSYLTPSCPINFYSQGRNQELFSTNKIYKVLSVEINVNPRYPISICLRNNLRKLHYIGFGGSDRDSGTTEKFNVVEIAGQSDSIIQEIRKWNNILNFFKEENLIKYYNVLYHPLRDIYHNGFELSKINEAEILKLIKLSEETQNRIVEEKNEQNEIHFKKITKLHIAPEKRNEDSEIGRIVIIIIVLIVTFIIAIIAK